jgi:hypothetical protein
MSIPWLKNLYTAAMEGTGLLNLTRNLEKPFSPI